MTRIQLSLFSGEEVTNLSQDSNTLLTNKDKEIDTDLVIKCTGLKVNSDAYSVSLGNVAKHKTLEVFQW